MKRIGKKTILGQPSWRVASKNVEAYVTEIGGQLAPVTFDRALATYYALEDEWDA